MIDKYQERYLAHQARKKEVLAEIMRERHSNRMFSQEEVPQHIIEEVLEAVELCPSSCDRKAVGVVTVTQRDEKEFLGGVLVGGVGWIHRAPVIMMIFADPTAYKGHDELNYMPFLDAGVVIQQLYLTATALGLSGAYANPNIRDRYKPFFKDVFGDKIFCGAFGFGFKHET